MLIVRRPWSVCWLTRTGSGWGPFNFNIRRGDDAACTCLRENRDFVEVVALPWFLEQSAAAAKRASPF
jgi:hypothetical protein